MYAGWKETKDGCLVTDYNPNHNAFALKPTTKGYELLEHLECGWFRHCEVFTIDDGMRKAARLVGER